MRTDAIINFVVLAIGILVAIAPWTFAPVCALPMRCSFTRDVETILGTLIASLALVAAYKALGHK